MEKSIAKTKALYCLAGTLFQALPNPEKLERTALLPAQEPAIEIDAHIDEAIKHYMEQLSDVTTTQGLGAILSTVEACASTESTPAAPVVLSGNFTPIPAMSES